MDNETLRELLRSYTGEFVPVLREELARLIVDSDELHIRGVHSCHDRCEREACVLRRELAKLRAEIAGAPVGRIYDIGIGDIRIASDSAYPDLAGQRVALLRLPAGSPGEDA